MTLTAREEHVVVPRRAIGRFGTAARVIVGGYLLVDVVHGELTGTFYPAAWLLALVGFPAGLLAVQWVRTRRTRRPLRATGPVGHAVNLLAIAALYFTPDYAPALAATSDAVLIFLGSTMLLAALRGYAGCETLAVPNWLLRRDDQVGCVLFWPIDELERRHAKPA